MLNLPVQPRTSQGIEAKHPSNEPPVLSVSAKPHLNGKNTGLEKAVRQASLDSDDSTICEPEPLGPKRQLKLIRHARHTFLNVYRRLFSLVFLSNLTGIAALAATKHSWLMSPPLSDFATAAAANLMVAILIRQDYIINALFKAAWLVPLSAPLQLRCMLCKVYEHGGVHSGAAVSSVLWVSLLTGFLTREVVTGKLHDPGILTVTYIVVTVLIALIATAWPRFRSSSHNIFENIHRWGSWLILALFWAEIVLFARLKLHSSVLPRPTLLLNLIRLPAFWFQLISTFHAIYPWLRLHKLYVGAEHLSAHVTRLHFLESIPQFVGLRISSSPLIEWHSFAAIPTRDGGKTGGSLIVSHAGDFTRSTIDNPKPYYYVKGIPVTGVLCMTQIFNSVVIVTTGSGIGPTLAVIQDVSHTRVRVIWSTRSPLETYGKEICKMVKGVDVEAVIWDTKVRGRPDLVRMAWDMYKEDGAEAVFMLGNPAVTRKVVYALESRGVPTFGPVWDS